MSPLILLISLSFVAIALFISYKEQLALEKDLLVGTIRAFIQLFVIGYVLQLIFDLRSLTGILFILALMILVASQNASQKSSFLPRSIALTYILGALLFAEITTMGLLLILQIVPVEPQYIIPISGMIIGNAMIAAGLTLSRLQSELASQKGLILTALALGATGRQAASSAIKQALRAGMSPTIDSMKTVGLVQLPGMMTGLIIAGASPIEAVKYQILIILVITASTAIASITVALGCYKPFFTSQHQLSNYYPRQ
ncbi:iron export ABC transporter permease subunit FetB [Heliorestis acidaminivorans]|uniref:Iron export ABC transporter permease subunit FetB n=1 Tax=Heliorestis acidaminivorans TaxID=553427 RepID=A0A6I0ETK4_9FIRM|nr:iron export ABC transporter permease subunit FetB [Heliorestis acidaminivorans]KAB2952398.1 iron export ABC transporter permease subunit FetB [Heliorestis acidaminivorans]